jgi:DNA polymerase-3 subunit alpha (Gram-positive type)
MVIPNDKEVYDFLHPSSIPPTIGFNMKTTHFDYRAIHDSLLKLDLLGHVDPLALKMMCEMTNIMSKIFLLMMQKSSPSFQAMPSISAKTTISKWRLALWQF